MVDAKMSWANLDMDVDQLTIKLNVKTQALKTAEQRISRLENDLVVTKQQLGDALNIV